MGAITSGRSACGILIGCSVAIGFWCGRDREGIPEEHAPDRNHAIAATGKLYRDFLAKFGSTECRALSGCDFSIPAEIARYMEQKIYKTTCNGMLLFAMEKCVELAEEMAD